MFRTDHISAPHRGWPTAATGTLLAITLLLGGCGGGDEPATGSGGERVEAPASPGAAAAPASNPTAGPSEGAFSGAVLSFENESHDFGQISDTESYRTSFRFTNTGTERLVIDDVKAACGCTIPELAKREYDPGESGEIGVVFNPRGKAGPTEKIITVVSNSTAEPTMRLHLESDIQPLVLFERMHNLGDIELGKGRVDVVTLTYRDPDLHFKEVTVNNPAVSARIVESGVVESTGDDVQYSAKLEVRVSEDAPWGLLYATRVHMEVNGRPRPEAAAVDYDYDLYLLGSVYGELRARTGIISLTGAGNAPLRGANELSREDQKPFTIKSVRVTESLLPGLTARAEPMSPSQYRIIVEGNSGTFRGSVRGIIAVETDVPGEEHITLRFAGQVR